MMTPPIPLCTTTRQLLADTTTPVSLYLKLRDQYAGAVLLESNDFRSKENCYSIIGLASMASFKVADTTIIEQLPDGTVTRTPITDRRQVVPALSAFAQRFQPEKSAVLNGLLGHTSYEAVQYFEDLEMASDADVPLLQYHLYRFLIVINHFKDELTLLENRLPDTPSELDALEAQLQRRDYATYPFRCMGDESSNLTDDDFKALVRAGKAHCQRGDVFQIVFSRQFAQRFQGDEFNVYRVLRSINPSPYLFYFDYGDYKIFGSSPEAQLVVENGMASINPIAGTYRRTGDDAEDARRAKALLDDPKENAEHIMLVDLARNDLSRHTQRVRMQKIKEIQYFSHVIHLVSTVVGDLAPDANAVQVFADTFPAGTLSGAPKYKALELIHRYESQSRGFYGGAIGYLGFNGHLNHAIVIRSFLSRDHVLYSQAGAGIVVDSDEDQELQEINNKLGALKQALLRAEAV